MGYPIGAVIVAVAIYFIVKKCGCRKGSSGTKIGESGEEKKGSSCCH